jgi:hypothetical protein
MGSAIESALRGGGPNDEGFAEDSTKKRLIETCVSAGGTWIEEENRCGTGSQPADLSALQSSCSAAGGRLDSSGKCSVPEQ